MNSLLVPLIISDSPIISDNPPKPNKILGTITVRRSMRIANQKRISYADPVFDEKVKSKKTTVRNILKMEISPIRQLKNLTIEARHTLSLQESKKKRLQFENSLFLPNNKKRKDVLRTYFNKKSSTMKNTKVMPNTSFFTSNKLKKHPVRNQPSYDSDISSKASEQSDKSPIKRNLSICNEQIEKISSMEELAFPSYVSFRTKINKLKLVKSKILPESQAHTTVQEQPSSSTIFEEPESTTISNGIEIQKSECSPDILINDLTQKSPSIERPTEYQVKSTFEEIEVDSSKFQTLLTQPASLSAINISPCWPSPSSNSMEFSIKSTSSNQSTASSSDCLEINKVETLNITQTDEIKDYTPNKIIDSLKLDWTTEAETNYLIRATSPKPLGVIVRNEKQPITSKLIQDAEIQSTSTSKTFQHSNETIKTPESDALIISTSITEDIQPLTTTPNIEFSPCRNFSDVPINQQEESNQPSSHDKVLNSLCIMQPNSQNNFETVFQQRQIIVDEKVALKSLDIEEKAESYTHGQNSPRTHLTEQENPSTITKIPRHSNSPSSTNGKSESEQAETQSEANSEIVDPLTKMQNKPNCNRYFTPFYLQRPVFETETTRSISTTNTPSVEQQYACMHVTTEPQLKEPLMNPSSSTHAYQTRAPLEAHGRNLHYSYTQTFNSQIDASQHVLSSSPANASQQNDLTQKSIGPSQQTVDNFPPHHSEQNNYTQKSIEPITKTSPVSPTAPGLPYSYPQAPNPQADSTKKISRKSPARSAKQNKLKKTSKSKTKTSQITPTTPSLPYSYHQAYGSQIGATQQILSNSTAHVSDIKTPPSYHNHPYYRPSYPSSASSYSTNQHRFTPFPAIQQQNNSHSNYVASTSNFQNSPPSHSPNANPNIYGYPPTHFGNPHQPYNGQPYFPSLQSIQHSSVIQTGVRTEQIHPSCDSRNTQPPSTVNYDMRHHTNCQIPCWGQNNPVVEPPSHPHSYSEPHTVDPNKWLNDRFQHIIKPHHDSKNDMWLARPQESIAPVSTSSINMDDWMRARTQQATYDEKITVLDKFFDSVNVVFKNFLDFKTPTTGGGLVNPQTGPVTLKTPPPWQTITNNSPIIRNIPTQPVPDPCIAWAEYNNRMNTMQMAGNIGYPGGNSPLQNSMRMEGNPVNQYPGPQNNSHQFHAADSTTGGNYNSCFDLRSFRPTQHYNQSHPHNASQYYKNPYTYFKTH